MQAVVLSFSSLFFVILYLTLRTSAWLKPIPSQRHIILIENYVIWWAILVFDTVLVNNYQIGALYAVNFFHAGAVLALLFGLIEILLLKPKTSNEDLPDDVDDPNVETEVVVDHERSTEETPLLGRKPVGLKSDHNEKEAGALWIVEYLLAVPFPVLFISQTALFALHSLTQTLSDGASPSTGK